MESDTPDSSPPERSRGRVSILVNLVVSAAILAASLYGYTFLGKRQRPARTKPPKPTATAVSTAPLQVHSGPISITANGVVVPLRELRLASEVAGRVTRLSENMRPGRRVSQGETLVEIDPIEFELEVRRLRAQQSQERAELAAIETSIENTTELLRFAADQVDLSKRESQRAAALVARQAASAAEVEVAERAELTAKSALVENENRRRDLVSQKQLVIEKQKLTEIQLERAQLDLSRTKIVSPIDGRIVASSIEEQSFLTAGTPFVTIEDRAAVEVRTNLTVDQMLWVWNSHGIAGDRAATDDRVPPIPATIEYRVGTRVFQWVAILHRVDGVGIDQSTRTYPCLFRVDQPDVVESVDNVEVKQGPDRLMRGMFVAVKILAEPAQTLYRVPESAIRPGNRVWISADDQLQILPVQIVSRAGDALIVEVDLGAEMLRESNISADKLAIVVSPISDPRQGMRISDEDSVAPVVSKPSHGPPAQVAGDVPDPTTDKAAG
jgi:multidrug efflux pump subunit AcrA (membrane-fusion protein)